MRTVCFVFGLMALTPVLAEAESFEVKAPNADIKVEIAIEGGQIYWQPHLNGKPVLAPSPIALQLKDGRLGQGDIVIAGEDSLSGVEDFAPVVGKTSHISLPYNDRRFHLKQTFGTQSVTYDLVFRATSEGVAYRFEIPKGQGAFEIRGDFSKLYLAKDFQCYGFNVGKYESSHEGEFDPIRASYIRPQHLYDYPLVCQTGQGDETIAFTEADLQNYPASYLSGSGDGRLGFEITLTPRKDNDQGLRSYAVAAKFDGQDDVKTPWRVIMMGNRATDLVQSNLIMALGAPSKVADTSWIKPGKVAWDWWNGYQAGKNPGINTETYLAYVDFAVANGFEYILIDEGWSVGSTIDPNPKADVTRHKPEVDIPAIVAYAKQRHVNVLVWVQWQQLDPQMDAALKQYEAWGLKGIKVDFMNRTDQEIMGFYDRLLSKAAQHHLMVDLHGAPMPSGLNRTYPHYMTQEGVMGAEYNKWSSRVTASHNVMLAYTRMILGPIDYTPGGFRHVTPEAFPAEQRFIKPVVMTTRGHALSMYVVYDSPLQMVADSPDAYVGQDGLDFLQIVPASWDETRILDGKLGQYIVSARRINNVWFVGLMTNEEGREVTLDLSFLPKGQYGVDIWQDGVAIDRLEIKKGVKLVTRTLTLKAAANGGAVARIYPIKR